MEGKKIQIDEAGVQRESVSVPPGHNCLIVRLQGQTWVSVSMRDGETIHEESSDPVLAFTVSPGNYTLRTNGKIDNLTTEAFQSAPSAFAQSQQSSPAFLSLSSNAPDRHIVDDIGEIPADGVSFCTITVEKRNFDGTVLTSGEHQDEIFLRTTGGVLMDEKGEQRIRVLKPQSGRAAFRLVSDPSPKLVTVSAFGREPHLTKAEIQIEFV